MTKHRTISQQQLHNDVRLVFPRNNCLLKLAALPLQMPTAQRQRCLRSRLYVCVCVYVYTCTFVVPTVLCVPARAANVCVFVCLFVPVPAPLYSCVVLNSFKCPTRNFISIRNPVSDASRSLSLSPSTSTSQSQSSSSRCRCRSWLWVRYKSISIGLSVFVGKKRRTVHTLSSHVERARVKKKFYKKYFKSARETKLLTVTVISQGLWRCLITR